MDGVAIKEGAASRAAARRDPVNVLWSRRLRSGAKGYMTPRADLDRDRVAAQSSPGSVRRERFSRSL